MSIQNFSLRVKLYLSNFHHFTVFVGDVNPFVKIIYLGTISARHKPVYRHTGTPISVPALPSMVI